MYKIIFSENSLYDLNEIIDVIGNYTGSEIITNTVYNKIIKEINLLNTFPYKFVKYGDYRILTITKKYRVFYKVEEDKKIVKIFRIFFSSSNYQEII